MTKTARLAKTLAAVTVAVVGFSACSSDDEPAAGGQNNQLEQLMASDASGDQRAAGGATSMAMELGFDQVQSASDEELASVRDNAAERAGTAEDMTVDPQSCAAPIAALDWSPILASSESMTRVDFGTSNFMGAGSVEVAGITEETGGSAQAAEEVAAHQQAVDEVTTNCHDITMMLADESEPDWAELEYTFTAESVETESGSGLLWQRYPTNDPDGGQSTTALTLMTEHEGYVLMVAFIGGEDIADEEFTDISEAILSSATAQLD